jgi:uncharacterized membrane protein
MRRHMQHARRTVSLGVVLACVAGTMALGTLTKAPCAAADWSDRRQYRLLCYTDVVPLLGTEQLQGGRLPYLEPCRPVDDQSCDEYPVLTMYTMRAAAWIAGESYAPFFYVNAVLLMAAAGITAACLWLLAGRRALWFALAPTLLIYGTVNWDLIAVAFATSAIVAFAARRDGWAGVLLGLGTAAKLYPALLLVPLLAQALQDREPDRAVKLAWGTVGAWLAVNLPFVIRARDPWWEFFRFNGARPPDWDSGWYIACRATDAACLDTRTVNLVSALLFVAVFAGLWIWKASRSPGFPRWTLALPILVCFLLTNKVYSPQYGLWLLPVLALVLPDLKPFVAFAIADVAVFVTRFRFFEELAGGDGIPQWVFEVAVGVRAIVLVWCVAAWLVRDADPLVLGRRGWRPATASAQEAQPA